jgi:shikimate kinase
MGSGKTFWGTRLSLKLNIPFFDLDEKISESTGMSINEIFAKEGEEYFRLAEKNTLHTITEAHDTFVMACGGGTPCYFNNIDYMNRTGTTVWISTSIEKLFERLIKERSERPLLRNLTDDQVKSFIIKKFSDRKIFYEQADVVIDDDSVNVDHLVEKVFHA